MVKLSRRVCLKGLVAGGAGTLLGDTVPVKSVDAQAVDEPARKTPVCATADVVVCGGGPAGVAAALSAARASARVILIEQSGCLGGIWTSGLLSYWLDVHNKKGLTEELMTRIEQAGGGGFSPKGQRTGVFDVEVTKLVLERLCEEHNIEIFYHSRIVAAQKVDSRLTHVILESKSGREAVAAKAFIDCTGDGDLGARSGCSFALGHPEHGKMQPMSMIALISGVQAQEITPFYNDIDDRQPWAAPKDRLYAAMEAGGHAPSYSKPTLFRVRDDLFILMANHEYGVSGISQRDVTRATLHARKDIHASVDALRKQGGVWQRVRIVATPEQIGVREGRRLLGRYTMTLDDLKEGRTFEDAACKVSFSVDIHALDPSKNKGIDAAPIRVKPYDIPVRALIAKEVEGLFFAGRCISGDFFAHSSYRVTGNAVAMGEAAGRVAAKASGKAV